MDDEPLSFEEQRRRREEDADTVRCARCGKRIMATAIRCPECGIHFHGAAEDFPHPSDRANERAGPPGWVVLVAVLLLAAIIVGVLGWQ